jgi:hypothetical protein
MGGTGAGVRGKGVKKVGNTQGLWTSNKTVEIKIDGKSVIIDEGIAPLVKVFNKNGLITFETCSGHAGKDEPAATHILFKNLHTATDKLDKIRNLINSGKLKNEWVLTNKGDNGLFHDLYLKKGLFGSRTLPSTDKVFRNVEKDFKSFINHLKGK